MFCLLSLCTLFANAQVVETQPALPVESDLVTLTFHADQGSKGLMGFTGDVYAHTGVITDKSTSDKDWKYVLAAWDENLPKAKMTRTATNTYQLSISASIRSFYGVPTSEKILKMAFVFRSADGSKEGKADGGSDIFVTVYQQGVNVAFFKPSIDYSIVSTGSVLPIEINASNHQSIQLTLNGELLESTTSSPLTYSLAVPTSGKHMLRAEAIGSSSSAADTVWFLVQTATVTETMPANLKRGVTRIDDHSVYIKLFAPQKQFVYVAADFNGWMPDNIHQMKRDGDYFWLQVDGLLPNMEYGFQYWIDNAIKIPDPYANKILDPFNDKYIPETVYPNLKKYPQGKTDEFVSVFKTNPAIYQWQMTGYEPPKPDTMVVYELHIRDFTANRDIKTLTDTLVYLKRLGINAVELMPFNEFEGNDSWGYNPAMYFAPDKAYGTETDYKQFIDACHQHGMAVIMDMVLNHSFGQSPMVRMYFENGKPAANNPWYNVNHNMQNTDAQWGYDFNHQSLETQAFVDSVCSFWMHEYQIDGFRFDFTKGFTNTAYGPSDWASAYDAQRISILKRMSDEIWSRKLGAIVIFEHLSDNKEETELADYGILMWGNHNHNMNEATMGYNESGKSDLSWANYQNRGWSKPHIINYMESHDEERLMFKNLEYGKVANGYSAKDLPTSLQRMQLAGVVLFSIPGPVMIWQFGELGYDVSIDTNGRTGVKPLHWEYLDDANRKAVYNSWAAIINLKKSEPVFSTTNFSTSVNGALKTIKLNRSGENVVIVGNFDVKALAPSITFPETGWWYDYFKGDSINVASPTVTFNLEAGEFRLWSQKKLTGFTPKDPTTPNDGYKTFAWPNPFSQSFSVANPFEGDVWLDIYNLTGQKVGRQMFNGPTSTITEAGGWQNGYYLLKLSDDGGNSVFQKLLKR